MQHRRLNFASLAAVAMAAVAVLGSSVTYAGGPGTDTTYDTIPTDLYISPGNSGLAIPSGQINVVPGETATTAVSKDAAAIPTDNTNMLGCGGVGQAEFTSGVFNMPESFGKFQQDVDSLLSKQLLTMNYAMPQSAALFDQLNNYGQQRYQSFQQGCSLDALKQDAKKQYLQACVTKLTPERKTLITNLYAASAPKGEEGATGPKEPLLSSMAYAQAWEVCTNQYVSDTTAFDLRKTTIDAFAKQVRAVENVTNAITPLLCPAPAANSGASTNNGCWPALLIPQVRLCLDDTLGCTDTNGYRIAEPLLTMPRLFDTMRFLMDDTIIARRVNAFTQQLVKNNVDGGTQKQAAAEAVLTLSNATLGRATDGSASGTVIMGNAANAGPDASVKNFQFSYLNCKDADIMSPLKQYAKNLNARVESTGGGATALTAPALVPSDYEKVIEKLGLTDADADQKVALRMLVWTSLGCTANQAVPIFDPNIMASLQNQCVSQDRYAYYSMAGNDVAMSATRDIYRYLALRLKQTYTQLLIQSTVPAAAAATPADPATPAPAAVVSPELNARLARVVKEVMIPQVEAQIDRLNDLANTRGEFAQRVQQIYANKGGCVYSNGQGTQPAGAGRVGKYNRN